VTHNPAATTAGEHLGEPGRHHFAQEGQSINQVALPRAVAADQERRVVEIHDLGADAPEAVNDELSNDGFHGADSLRWSTDVPRFYPMARQHTPPFRLSLPARSNFFGIRANHPLHPPTVCSNLPTTRCRWSLVEASTRR
jgi:hypothetical protein